MQTQGVAQWIREQLQTNPKLNADDVIAAFPALSKVRRGAVRNYISRARTGNLAGRSVAERERSALKGTCGEVEIEKPVKPTADTTIDEDRAGCAQDYWRGQYTKLSKKYDTALKDSDMTSRLVDLATTLAPRSYVAHPFQAIQAGKVHGKGTPQTAVLVFSDSHVGQVVTREQTLGFGGYNFAVFCHRLKLVENRVLSFVKDKNLTNPTETLFVAMLGDMIHGALQHSSEADQHATRFAQFYAAGHVISQFFRNLSPYFKHVQIETCVGNHPRFGEQHKMPTVNRYSNLDQFLYAYIAALLRDVPNITLPLHCEPFRVVEVEGLMIHLSHGDHLRGGDKALGIPNHSVARQINATTQLFDHHGRRVPDCYLVGHFHRPISIPFARGNFIFNGGFPGLDGYGLDGNFNPVDPFQTFFFIHPEYGVHSKTDIQLARAVDDGTLPYQVPNLDQFPVR
jgi:hypothetical protein